MKILFLDQSGRLGGAELCLADIVQALDGSKLVGLLQDGPFRERLETLNIPVEVFTNEALQIRKESGLLAGLKSLQQIIPLTQKITQRAADYDVIYANTPKALVVGALASWLSRRSLVYHLHDILSPEHFSATNRQILIFLANYFSSLIIANSEATKTAFIQAGGESDKVSVVYNGFRLQDYPFQHSSLSSKDQDSYRALRQKLGLTDKFVVGHFSRLAPWKGQHVLVDALTRLPQEMIVLFVGDALFGEDDYVRTLHQQIEQLGLGDRIHFLGFQSDVPTIMSACDLVAHTSTAPEPFGRVIVEAMLCARPVVAAAAGGAVELVKPGETGWLCPPNDPVALAEIIRTCANHPEESQAIALEACKQARVRFDLVETNRQIQALLSQYEKPSPA